MERSTCEKKIIRYLKKIEKVYSIYNPEGRYLSMMIIDGQISVNNSYYDKDSGRKIHCCRSKDDRKIYEL